MTNKSGRGVASGIVYGALLRLYPASFREEYGREMRAWARKCFEASRQGAQVVLLAHARTDTRWIEILDEPKCLLDNVRRRFGHLGDVTDRHRKVTRLVEHIRDGASKVANVLRCSVQLVLQMLGERIRAIFHPLEIRYVLVSATAGRPDIGEAVGFQRLAVPIEVERLVRPAGHDGQGVDRPLHVGKDVILGPIVLISRGHREQLPDGDLSGAG